VSALQAQTGEAKQEVSVSLRFAPISPRKARLVVDLIRGATVDEAFNVLRMTRKRASTLVSKLLRSAVATAGEQHDVEAEDLYIVKVWVDPGPMRRKWWARPRGMMAPKRSRTSHIHLVVAALNPDEEEEGA